MLEEFKKFALRGNVVNLAIGVIIGAVTGGLDFSNYFVRLSPRVTADSLAEAKKQGVLRLTLLTDKQNKRAQALYRKLGFAESTMKAMRLKL